MRVDFNPASASGKARKARNWGIPILSIGEVLSQMGEASIQIFLSGVHMSMHMPDELPRYVSASHETYQENKGTRYDPGIVHRPRGGSVTSSEDFDSLLDHD